MGFWFNVAMLWSALLVVVLNVGLIIKGERDWRLLKGMLIGAGAMVSWKDLQERRRAKKP